MNNKYSLEILSKDLIIDQASVTTFKLNYTFSSGNTGNKSSGSGIVTINNLFLIPGILQSGTAIETGITDFFLTFTDINTLSTTSFSLADTNLFFYEVDRANNFIYFNIFTKINSDVACLVSVSAFQIELHHSKNNGLYQLEIKEQEIKPIPKSLLLKTA